MINNKYFNIKSREEFDFYINYIGVESAFLGYLLNKYDDNLGYVPFTTKYIYNDLNIGLGRVYRNIDHLANINMISYYKTNCINRIYFNNDIFIKYNNFFLYNFSSKLLAFYLTSSLSKFVYYRNNFNMTIALLVYLIDNMDEHNNTLHIKRTDIAKELFTNVSSVSRCLNKLKKVGFVEVDNNNHKILVDNEFVNYQ